MSLRMRSRLGLAMWVAVVGGCQCFSPVSEDTDGGGSDASFDAGVVAECSSASECGTTASRPPCWAVSPPVRSCFDHRCVFDCGAQPRACESSNGMCLTCDGGATTCAAGCGSGFQNGERGRLYKNCGDGGTAEQLGGYELRYAQGATCNFVFTTDAGVTGTIDARGADQTSVATISLEPGVSCTVTTLATALNRSLLGCAQCIYLLESP